MAKLKPGDRPNVILAADIPESLANDLKHNGLWRCGVVVPNCNKRPYASIKHDVIQGYRLFCLPHAMQYAAKAGYVLPKPEDN